jgi:hypothetical protein
MTNIKKSSRLGKLIAANEAYNETYKQVESIREEIGVLNLDPDEDIEVSVDCDGDLRIINRETENTVIIAAIDIKKLRWYLGKLLE